MKVFGDIEPNSCNLKLFKRFFFWQDCRICRRSSKKSEKGNNCINFIKRPEQKRKNKALAQSSCRTSQPGPAPLRSVEPLGEYVTTDYIERELLQKRQAVQDMARQKDIYTQLTKDISDSKSEIS